MNLEVKKLWKFTTMRKKSCYSNKNKLMSLVEVNITIDWWVSSKHEMISKSSKFVKQVPLSRCRTLHDSSRYRGRPCTEGSISLDKTPLLCLKPLLSSPKKAAELRDDVFNPPAPGINKWVPSEKGKGPLKGKGNGVSWDGGREYGAANWGDHLLS